MHALTHKEMIDIVQHYQEKSSALEGVTKTKTRGVLALLKHAGAIDSFTPVNDSVQITFNVNIRSFEDFRGLHDKYLLFAANDCSVDIPTGEWKSLTWDAFTKKEILQSCLHAISGMASFLSDLPETFLSDLSIQNSPIAGDEISLSSQGDPFELPHGLIFGYDSSGSSEFSFKNKQLFPCQFETKTSLHSQTSTSSPASQISTQSILSALTVDSPAAGLVHTKLGDINENSELEELMKVADYEDHSTRIYKSSCYSLFPDDSKSINQMFHESSEFYNEENEVPMETHNANWPSYVSTSAMPQVSKKGPRRFEEITSVNPTNINTRDTNDTRETYVTRSL